MVTQHQSVQFYSIKRENLVRFSSCFLGFMVLEYGSSRTGFRAYTVIKEGILWKPIFSVLPLP